MCCSFKRRNSANKLTSRELGYKDEYCSRELVSIVVVLYRAVRNHGWMLHLDEGKVVSVWHGQGERHFGNASTFLIG